jgi:hypothetical protein
MFTPDLDSIIGITHNMKEQFLMEVNRKIREKASARLVKVVRGAKS